MTEIKFDTTTQEAAIILKIAQRADREIFKPNRIKQSVLDTSMDITAVHLNGHPLRLGDLLTADEFNFAHDICGIRRHLDRKTVTLGGCFVPRYAKPKNV